MLLRSIQFSFTSRCNLECSFCPYHGSESSPIKTTELEIGVYKRAINDLSTLSVLPTVKLAGSGEPTLYHGFDDLIGYLKQGGYNVRLITNGTTLPSKAKFLSSGLSQLVVSIHGEKVAHDEVVKQSGAYDKAISGIEIIKRINPELEVLQNTVITPMNYSNLEKIAEKASDLGVNVRFQHMKYVPGNEKLGNFDLGALVAIIQKIKQRFKTAIFEPDLSVGDIAEYYDSTQKFILNPHACWRILFDLNVNATGDVLGCDGISMGNIINTSLLDIIDGDKRIKFVTAVQNLAKTEHGLPDYCSRCCYNSKEPVTKFSSFHNSDSGSIKELLRESK